MKVKQLEISLTYHNLIKYDVDFNLKGHFLTSLFSQKLALCGLTVPKIRKIVIALIKGSPKNLFLPNEGVILFKSDFNLLESSYEKAISSKH